jgi:hypothetical protein
MGVCGQSWEILGRFQLVMEGWFEDFERNCTTDKTSSPFASSV